MIVVCQAKMASKEDLEGSPPPTKKSRMDEETEHVQPQQTTEKEHVTEQSQIASGTSEQSEICEATHSESSVREQTDSAKLQDSQSDIVAVTANQKSSERDTSVIDNTATAIGHSEITDTGDKEVNDKVMKEEDVGITEYISTHKGFQGIIKQRFVLRTFC